MILQREISKSAQRDGVPERTVEKHYAIHWLMLGLATTALHAKLAFKGGTSLRLCHFKGHRYSEDVDLTALAAPGAEEARDAFAKAFAWIGRESAVPFELPATPFEAGADGFSFHVGYSGPLGAQAGRRDVKIDVNWSERLCFPVRARKVNRHYSDIPSAPFVRCYSIEEVLVEKFRSLLNPARREPRDVYDLAFLIEHAPYDLGEVAAAFRTKAEFKRLAPDALVSTIDKKERALAALWEKRLANQVAALPPFGAAFKSVRREARALVKS